ncbi:hypothetical protein, partial [Candidatus Ichthyocystis sparus]|uniref:hypothetical protein n=1 Tax=Candidatus Ichthyocystis sparus TaxID=1561004 RepID=UPI001F5E3F02
GGSLLVFLSKIDCAVTVRVKYIFKSRWDKVARDVFAELEDGSLSGVRCEDVINVLDVAGVPVVALSDSKRYKLKGKLSRAALSDLKRRMRTTDEGKVVALSDSKRCKAKGKLSRAALSDSKRRIRTTDKGKISESGNKTVDKGTTSGGVTADPMSSSSSLQLQSELPSQPEPDSLPEGTVSSLPIVTESIPQTRVIRVISKSKASGSGDKATGEGTTASGSGIVAVSPGGTVSSLPPIAGSVPQIRVIRVISKSKASGSGDKATGEGTTASGSGIVAVSPGGTVSSLPPIAGSVPQVRIIRVISKSKASGSGDKATTGEGTASGSGIVAVSPDNAGSSSPIVTETVPQVRIIRVISKSRASGSGINVTSDAASSGGGVVVSPDGTKSSLPSITGSVPQTRVISESKISGDSGKCAEGTGSGSRAIDLTRRLVVSLSRLKCQHELSSQPESSLSPVGTVPQRRVITESKTSGGSSKCVEGTDSGSSAIELTRRLVVSIPRLKLQHELSSQPGSSLSPVGTVPQRRVISKSKTSEGSSKCAEGTESVSSTAALTHSLVISPTQLRPELSSQSESLPNPYPQSETQSRSLLLLEEKYDHPSPRFVKLLSCRDQPAIQLRSVLLLEGEYDQSSSRFVKSLSYREQPANLSDIVAVSTPDEPPSNYSDFGALVGELSPAPSSPPSVSFAPLSLSPSTSESEPQSQYETQLGSLLPLEYDSELHSPKFVKLFSSYKDQPGNVPVADTVSTFVALPEGDAGS